MGILNIDNKNNDARTNGTYIERIKKIEGISLKSKWLLLLLFFIISPLYSEEIDSEEYIRYDPNAKKELNAWLYGKIGYSFLIEYNLLLGFDLILDHRYPWQWEGPYFFHIIGIDYQYKFISNESIFRLNYTYHIFLLFPNIGVSFLYNINNNDIGIAPQIGVHLFFLSFYYRYNIILNNTDKNFHELLLSFNVILPLSSK